MLLYEIATASEELARTPSRLKKITLLTRLLQRLPPDEIAIAVDYLCGVLRQGRIGIGPSRLFRLAHLPASVPTLTLAETDREFDRLQELVGTGSSAARTAALGEFFSRATPFEQAFLIRLILGELRQGALEGVMLEAVAQAARVPPPLVRRAAMLAGDIATAAIAVLTRGAAGGEQFFLTLFRPVAPMLAQPAANLKEAFKRVKEADLQWKLDGARIQLHKDGQTVRIYSRNLNDVTAAVPELAAGAAEFEARSLILDGEAIALRPDGSPYPFQSTMSRFGTRLGVEAKRGELPLSPFYFDCLLLDGESLIDQPQRERFARMERVVPQEAVIPHLATSDPAAAEAFLEEVLERGHEGVMVKALDAPYEAGRRGYSWLKVKPAQTLDLVVLAAEWGHGRRRGYLSNLHLGARDEERGGFVMLGKTFKGLTDQMLAWQTEKLLEIETSRDAATVYVEPKLVAEVAFSDIQASPRYPAGLALRFARVRRYRPDKDAAQADTVATVRELLKR